MNSKFTTELAADVRRGSLKRAAEAISWIECAGGAGAAFLSLLETDPRPLIIGITGAPGVGKSTLVDQLIHHYRRCGHRVGVIAVDPSSPVTGGAVLGDRVRMMRHAADEGVFIRSLSSRGSQDGLSRTAHAVARILCAVGFPVILLETVGVGQVEAGVTSVADVSLLLLAPGSGDYVQSLKSGLVELVDVVVINKLDLPGSATLVADMMFSAEKSGVSIVSVSAQQGIGMERLIAAIDRVAGTRLSGNDPHCPCSGDTGFVSAPPATNRNSDGGSFKTEGAAMGLREWETSVLEPALRRFPERLKSFKTASGMDVDRVGFPEVFAQEYLDKLGFPGGFPFTRGVHPTMYRARYWTMRQYAGFSTAEESNKRFRYLLENGTNGLSVAFDLPTQLGYDSDHPLSRGEVGRVGVAIDSLEDMESLFYNIPLDRVSTSMTINATAIILLAMYMVVAEKQGVPTNKLAGTIQNDILKEYVSRGTHIFPPAPSIRLTTDIFVYCSKNLPKFNCVSVSGYHIREAGCSAPQEIAFTLANACVYVESALKRGLEIDEFAPRIAFFFNASSDIFEEVAKYRAARRIWARIVRDRFGARKPSSMMLRFHAQTSGYTLAAQQIDNNVVRVTLQALAAVLGGAQSIHTNGRDEALALPTEESAKLALRTQQIIAHESGVADSVDPLGGSYHVEKLTDLIEERALEILDAVDVQGGMVLAVEKGWVQDEIDQTAFEFQMDIDGGNRIVVGVNRFQDSYKPNESDGITKIHASVEEVQCRRVKRLRIDRDSAAMQKAVDALRTAALGSENLFPYVLEAVRSYATVGEISDSLRGVFGEFR